MLFGVVTDTLIGFASIVPVALLLGRFATIITETSDEIRRLGEGPEPVNDNVLPADDLALERELRRRV